MIGIKNNNHWLKSQADHIPDQIAIFEKDFQVTYCELYKIVYRTGKYLKLLGVDKDEKVLLVASHSPEFIITLNALWLLCAVPIPVSSKLTDIELTEIAEHSASEHIIDTEKIYDLKNHRLLNPIEIKNVSTITIDKDLQLPEFNPSYTCMMMYTSGSTGRPKCVRFNYANIYESALLSDSYIDHTPDDRWLVSLPLNHIGGFSILSRGIISGCALVFPKNNNHNELISAIKIFKPSLISLVPSMMQKILNEWRDPWQNLRHIFLGGGPVSQTLVSEALMNYWPVSVVYGSTETASMVCVSSKNNLKLNGISAGIPLKDVKIDIEKYPEGSKDFGRIVIKSKSVAVSYYKVDAEIENDLKQGVFYSGDLGRIDEKGNLQILGRIDDIIISGGENISLMEIENLLKEKAEFENCRAVGIKNEKWGQSYIIITDSNREDIDRMILEFLKEKVSKFKLPYKVVIMEKIPVNDLGKLNKNQVKKNLNFDFL